MELVMTNIVRPNKFLLLLVIVFALNTESFAARGDFGKPTIGAMMLMGSGQMGNDTDVLKRNMLYTPLAVFAGVNYKKFRFAINYEYNVVGQTDDPASFSNQNIGGKGSAAGLRLEFYDGKQAFGLIYRASEKYTLDKATLAGTVSEYDGKGGFGIQYYRQLKNRIGIVVDYSMGTLNSAAGNSDDLTWNRASLGLVFTNFSSIGRR
jgi:hypothetical protein